MWKKIGKENIKQNHNLSRSVIIATFISAVFLSLLCSLFYNMWKYDTERIIKEEGAWHVRISGTISKSQIEMLKSIPSVKNISINDNFSDGAIISIELELINPSNIYKEIPKMIETVSMSEVSVEYHTVLLTNYLVFDPNDKTPPLLMLFYLFVLLIASFSLILIIHNTFEVAMNSQVEQIGVLSVIGATSKQIRNMLIEQALMLSFVPIVIGSLLGILFSAVMVMVINILSSNIEGRIKASFSYRPGILFLTIVISVITVLLSSVRPAQKMSKITPLQAIRGCENEQINKRYRVFILSKIFGIKGELAGSILKKQKKSLRTAMLSLTFAFLGFVLTLSFFTLSGISTKETYFERYKDVWDVMLSIKNADIDDVISTKLPEGVHDAVFYQKGETSIEITSNELSEEVLNISQIGEIAGIGLLNQRDTIELKASIVVMDDKSFDQYCRDSALEIRHDGIVIWNYCWNSVKSDFRHKEYVPFLKEDIKNISLECNNLGNISFEVAGYTDILPILREEYASGSLVLVIPNSLWIEKKVEILCENTTYIRMLANNRNSIDELKRIEDELNNSLCNSYVVESENRISEEKNNNDMILGLQCILGGFCGLLALIGLGDVFLYTLCFVNDRKKEYARYLVIGMTQKEMIGMFAIEAAAIACRPLLITVPISIVFIAFSAKASYLSFEKVLAELPIWIMVIFVVVIFLNVAFAYYIGVKRLFKKNLVEVLRDDRMN